MKITFVLPSIRLYGGIKSTITMADELSKLGHDVSLVYPLLPGRDGLPWWNLRRYAVQTIRFFQNWLLPNLWFQFSGHLIAAPWLSARFLPPADFLILTWWSDVIELHNIASDRGYPIHFVRSYETWGGPDTQVKKTYTLPLTKIATSQTLANRLPIKPAAIIANGLDHNFFSLAPAADTQLPICRIGVLYRQQDWKRMD
ncbi:MAG: hypothetical protein KUG79_00005, partial [Pseudomonadales bacterium]|nr:hypothetical protein [Pseudomonadales bacterium]